MGHAHAVLHRDDLGEVPAEFFNKICPRHRLMTQGDTPFPHHLSNHAV